jgi:hypothetical protein
LFDEAPRLAARDAQERNIASRACKHEAAFECRYDRGGQLLCTSAWEALGFERRRSRLYPA